jgi:hypothetical protein
MSDNLPIPAATANAGVRTRVARLAPAKVGRVRWKRPMCAGCRFFERRDPAEPWPVAGVPTVVHGQCAAPRPGDWRGKAWRSETDWCDQHTPRQQETKA